MQVNRTKGYVNGTEAADRIDREREPRTPRRRSHSKTRRTSTTRNAASSQLSNRASSRRRTGKVVWDNDSYAFLTGDAPSSVNPSLWRQSILVSRQGLFEVVDGIYQVRGLDLSNISFIETDTGVIVIDPLISTETAAAALGLYREHRGDRPVVAVIFSHSHVDHFGGVFGVASVADVEAGKIAIIAPEGFVEHAIAENVYAGTAMSRRAGYMYGAVLARGPQGQVGAGPRPDDLRRGGRPDRPDRLHHHDR